MTERLHFLDLKARSKWYLKRGGKKFLSGTGNGKFILEDSIQLFCVGIAVKQMFCLGIIARKSDTRRFIPVVLIVLVVISCCVSSKPDGVMAVDLCLV